MMSDPKTAPLADWDTEQIRLTAFVAEGVEIEADNWWQDVLGAQPDSSTKRPKIGDLFQKGAALGGQITMRAQPTRVDWVFNPTTELPEERLDRSEIIAPFGDALAKFSEIVERWFKLAPPINRLAFGPIVLLPVNDAIHGLQRLMSYLPVLEITASEDITDLLFRINRRRMSQSGIDLMINRLSAWSVVTVEYKHLVPGKGILSGGKPSHSCRVELDINTAPDYPKTFNREQVLTLWGELKTLGVEIIEKGAIP